MRIFWVYILSCSNGAYYTGYTTDLVRRYREHCAGTNKCKYTRSFTPVGLAQCWQVIDNQALAMTIEKYIKKMSKVKKEQLIADPQVLAQLFDCLPLEKDKITNILQT